MSRGLTEPLTRRAKERRVWVHADRQAITSVAWDTRTSWHQSCTVGTRSGEVSLVNIETMQCTPITSSSRDRPGAITRLVKVELHGTQ